MSRTTPKEMRILVVEGGNLSTEILAKGIRQGGYQVETADSVAEAVKKSTGNSFDLVLLDLGLPDGDGPELVGLLKEGTSGTGALSMTEHRGAEVEKLLRRQGLYLYMVKHSVLKELLEEIKMVLDHVIHQEGKEVKENGRNRTGSKTGGTGLCREGGKVSYLYPGR